MITAMILTSTSLSELTFKSGQPLPGVGSNAPQPLSETSSPKNGPEPLQLANGILCLILLGMIAYVAIRVLLKIEYKTLLKYAAGILLIILIFSQIPETKPAASLEISGGSLPPIYQTDTQITPLGTPPAILSWVLYLAGLAMIALVAFVLLKDQNGTEVKFKAQVAQEVEGAIEAIRKGDEIRNVIIRCYSKMSQTISVEQGIARDDNMSAREFEAILVARGFPKDAIHRLTLLFEQARYNTGKSTPDEERESLDCLGTILSHCEKQP